MVTLVQRSIEEKESVTATPAQSCSSGQHQEVKNLKTEWHSSDPNLKALSTVGMTLTNPLIQKETHKGFELWQRRVAGVQNDASGHSQELLVSLDSYISCSHTPLSFISFVVEETFATMYGSTVLMYPVLDALIDFIYILEA